MTTPTQQTPPAPVAPPAAPQPLLPKFALCIQQYEGFVPPGGRDSSGKVWPNGTPAWRNKNPGNCRWPFGAPYPKGAVGVDAGIFLVFSTYDAGMEYLEATIRAIAAGTADPHGAYALRAKALGLNDTSELTVLQYFEVRDPPADQNDPAAYARYVGRQLGFDETTFLMKHLL